MFWLPYAAGRTGELPLRSIRAGLDSDDGPQVETSWDLYALAGKHKPEGVDAEGDVDYLGERGPGLGGRFRYDQPGLRGEAEGYLLPLDSGEDEIAGPRGHRVRRRHPRLPPPVTARTSPTSGSSRSRAPTSRTRPSSRSSSTAGRTSQALRNLGLPQVAGERAGLHRAGQGQRQRLHPPAFRPAGARLGDGQAPRNRLPRHRHAAARRPAALVQRNLRRRDPPALRRRQPADRGFTQSQSRELFGIDRDVSFDTAAANRGLDDDVHFRFDSGRRSPPPSTPGRFA